MIIHGINSDYVPGFLKWLAGIVLESYYNQFDPENTYEDDEVTTMVEMTELWLTNDKQGVATPDEVYAFMFDNRRL